MMIYFPTPLLVPAVAFLSICIALPLPVQSPAKPSALALDSTITAQMDGAGIRGVGAAIIIRGTVVWSQGYGHADYDRTTPFTTNTVMTIASITKPFVGVAMMRAVEEGKLDLDVDINRYLPFRVVNPHHPTRPITLRQLATMTSGITDRWEVYASTYRFGSATREPLGEFLRHYFTPPGRHYARENFLAAVPGTRREYSNIGTALAGYIVERAVGQPLNLYTRTHIFVPLGMSRSGWFPDEINQADLSTQFMAQNGMTTPIQSYTNTTYPDGGIRTSVADLSKFFIAMLNGGTYDGSQILAAKSIAEMVRFQFDDSNRPENVPAADGNSGLFWRTKYNGARIGFGGNDPGVQTEMLANLSKDVAVIVFSNTSLGGADQRAFGAMFNAIWAHAEGLR